MRPTLSLSGANGWTVDAGAKPALAASTNQPIVQKFSVRVGQEVQPAKPYFSRASIQESRYTVANDSEFGKPWADPSLWAVASYQVAGAQLEARVPVMRFEADLHGNRSRVLAVVPAIGVRVTPASAIVPLANVDKKIQLRVEIVNNKDGGNDGVLSLPVPRGWRTEPRDYAFKFTRAGERAFFPFTVTVNAIGDREYQISAVAVAGGRMYREGYDAIEHRDLETRYLFHDAATSVRGVDVRIAPTLHVGYVMGIGDDVPSAIEQLGADVKLLETPDLSSGDLSRFDAIITGTRAYTVREDLKIYNRRLLDYVQNGGDLIVLYNTAEYVPNLYAPFAAELPQNAEEVSEEDAPVEILAADASVLNSPNRITNDDFSGWVEQRGSKFWSRWDAVYTPIITTHDQGQAPQRGGWLHARYGKGHYTYFAYALHRQLPYGVPGAYRLLANLLSQVRPF